MSKSARIISRLEIKSLNVVKGINMEGLRVVGSPEKLAKKYYEEGVDEIILSDIVASLYGRNQLLDLIKKVSQEVTIPIVVGGGVRTLKDIESLLKSGADKVTINTQAVYDNNLIKEASKHFGAQCIIVEVHAKKLDKKKWEVFVENGRQPTNMDVSHWIKKAQDLGAGEVLLVSVDKDGTNNGFEKDLIAMTKDKISIPLIIGGGFKDPKEIIECIDNFNIDAFAISHALHFNKITIGEIKKIN